ncbi:MAG: pyridoxamine 5'-phosphate oxidase family protein [Dehalococcoidia bacterium]
MGAVIDPIEEIVAERERAREKDDPNVNVCFLATVTSEGKPTVRGLSLRDIDHRGFGLLISTLSKKWEQIHRASGYELLIYWATVRRQYRVRGHIAPMEEELVQEYWDRKGHGSRLLEHYYPTFEHQSTPVPSYEHLLEGMEALRKRHPEGEEVPLPQVLKGIYLVPQQIEAWHGGRERLHLRRLYTRHGDEWTAQVLVP